MRKPEQRGRVARIRQPHSGADVQSSDAVFGLGFGRIGRLPGLFLRGQGRAGPIAVLCRLRGTAPRRVALLRGIEPAPNRSPSPRCWKLRPDLLGAD